MQRDSEPDPVETELLRGAEFLMNETRIGKHENLHIVVSDAMAVHLAALLMRAASAIHASESPKGPTP